MANTTTFKEIYSGFLSKITDDMYMELTEKDTYKLLKELLLSAIPWFEFPKQNISNYSVDLEEFNLELTPEEINILSTYMVVEWLGQQLASVENTRMKYSGADFKFTSQANHIAKLQSLRKEYERQGFHLQRLYSRREVGKTGQIESTFYHVMGFSEGSRYES